MTVSLVPITENLLYGFHSAEQLDSGLCRPIGQCLYSGLALFLGKLGPYLSSLPCYRHYSAFELRGVDLHCFSARGGGIACRDHIVLSHLTLKAKTRQQIV